MKTNKIYLLLLSSFFSKSTLPSELNINEYSPVIIMQTDSVNRYPTDSRVILTELAIIVNNIKKNIDIGFVVKVKDAYDELKKYENSSFTSVRDFVKYAIDYYFKYVVGLISCTKNHSEIDSFYLILTHFIDNNSKLMESLPEEVANYVKKLKKSITHFHVDLIIC